MAMKTAMITKRVGTDETTFYSPGDRVRGRMLASGDLALIDGTTIKHGFFLPLAAGQLDPRSIVAIRRTWEAIAADIEDGRQACGETGDMPLDEAAEVVLDAGHLESYGDDAEAVAELRALSFEERRAVACEALKRYGFAAPPAPKPKRDRLRSRTVSVEVSTGAYELAHGRKPKGWGCWAFEIARETVWIPGTTTYAKARSEAKRIAASRRVSTISVAT